MPSPALSAAARVRIGVQKVLAASCGTEQCGRFSSGSKRNSRMTSRMRFTAIAVATLCFAVAAAAQAQTATDDISDAAR